LSSEVTKSALYEVQARQGASFMEFWDWYWTTTFGDVNAEYRAIREGVGVSDISPLVRWEFRGRGGAELIQRVFTNHVVSMAAGQVRYGAVVDVSGHIVDDATLFRLAEDRFWLMTNRADLGAFFDGFRRGEGVELENVTRDWPLVSLQGPGSRDLLSTLTSVDIAQLGYFRFFPEQVPVAGVPTWVSRTGYSGELGYELFVAPDDAPRLWEAVGEAGAVGYGFTASDIQRIESGLLVLGVDYEPGVDTPYDVSLDQVVMLDAPFEGRVPLVKVAQDPPRRFVSLGIQGPVPPASRAEVTQDGTRIGRVTSATVSPLFGTIALAVVDASAGSPDTEVAVAVDAIPVEAQVGPPALYDPSRARRRA
jgi:aminomethyltransferase